MKKLTIYMFFIAACLVSCSKFDSINTDPNNPSNIKAELLLNNIMYSAFGDDNDVANQTGSYSTFVGADMGACWAQHIGKVQYNDEERYNIRVGVVQDFWETYYEDVCKDATTLYELADKEGNTTLQGIALVLKAYGFHVLTDCYGSIPYSEALQGKSGVFSPKYDSQEDVYKGILSTLDEAIEILSGSPTGTVSSGADVMYNGDETKWLSFANSLKFRCLMRISNKIGSTSISVATQLQSLYDGANMFTSNDDEAKFNFAMAQPAANPFYETIDYGSRNEFRIGASLVDKLDALNDPRLEVYAKPNSTNQYVGKPAGYLNLPNDDYNVNNMSALNDLLLEPDAPAYFMSYSELEFLIAEALAEGIISGGSAQTHYNNGIQASFDRCGITMTLASYFDNNNAGYSAADASQKIAEQNWIALFGQGVEAWIEQKRTGFPVLTPAINGAFNSIPKRYSYPINEQSINATNYNTAVSSQGADLLTTKIWWMN